jgi:lysophospholipase L1-like esterase
VKPWIFQTGVRVRTLVVLSLVVLVAGSCSSRGSELQVEEGPLIYVALGNSFTFYPLGGNGVIHEYAEILGQDFAVEVDLRDWTVGGQRADDFVTMLVGDQTLHEHLAEADVITLLVPFDEWREPMQTATGYLGKDPADCGGSDNQQCLRDMVDTYKARVNEAFEALTSLVDPSETLIRAQDIHLFPTNAANEARDILYPYFIEANDHVEEVAGGYGIPVAKVLDEFAGPDGTKNAEEAGFISSDHRHPSAEGARRIAELIHDLGYDLPG